MMTTQAERQRDRAKLPWAEKLRQSLVLREARRLLQKAFTSPAKNIRDEKAEAV